MEYLYFKLLHLIGVMILFAGIGGLSLVPSMEGPTGTRRLRILRGLGFLIVLVSGVLTVYFMHLDGPNGVPHWVKAKVFILIALGATVPLARSPKLKRYVFPLSIILGCLAGYVALFKPF
jgi:uncharacterized membrane protein SirB2